MIDSIKKLLNNNKIAFDMYNNANSDDCKSKYNSLIFFLAGFMVELKQGKYRTKEKKYYLDMLKYNKETILMFLNLTMDILNNQTINEDVLLNENMDYIKDLKGNLDLKTLDGKVLFLNQIRNAFAHKSGAINFYIENNIKKVKIDNKGWFSIETNLTDLNHLLNKVTSKKPQTSAQAVMLETINNIQNDNYQNISDNAVIVLLLNLLMCYNKESLFDKFMLTQSSFIDASNFKIISTSNWNCTEAKLRQRFFDKFNIIFHSDNDKNSYNNEWKSIVDIDSSANVSQSNYIYDVTKMPFDKDTKRHIPIPIFMNALRNANCHGRIKIEGDYFIFYDQENSTTSKPYFYMKIKTEDLLEFIFSDYFVESITTTIEDHQSKYSSNLYLLEQAQSVNNFSNYIDIYRNRMPHLSEAELIKYMYDNNKFSSYLIEYPEQIDSFLEYKLKDGVRLISLLCQFNNMPPNSFNNISTKRMMKLKIDFELIGLKAYEIFLNDCTTNILDLNNNIIRNKDYEFFKLYYLFIRNLKSINPNIQYEKFEQLDEKEKQKIDDEIKEFQYEFIDNDTSMSDSESSNQIFTEIGMQNSSVKEINRIIFAVTFGKLNQLIKSKEKQANRFTIKNIEKHSSLAHVYEESASNNYKLAVEDIKNIAKVLALNLGTKLFNSGITMWSRKNGLSPNQINMEMICYIISIPIINLSINSTWIKLTNKLQLILKYKNRVDKYSENNNGGNEDENRNDGSYNITR